MRSRPRVAELVTDERAERPLLEHLRQGQERAFEALYLRYADRTFRLAVYMLRDEERARNAMQETFVRVFRKIHTFRGESGLGTWIYRIATNVCLDEIQSRNRDRSRYQSCEDLCWVPDRALGGGPEEQARRKEMMALLDSMLGRLEPKKRATFILHYVEELTADEIAQVLDEGRGTVLKRLQRTREELVEMAVAEGVNDESIEEAASHETR